MDNPLSSLVFLISDQCRRRVKRYTFESISKHYDSIFLDTFVEDEVVSSWHFGTREIYGQPGRDRRTCRPAREVIRSKNEK